VEEEEVLVYIEAKDIVGVDTVGIYAIEGTKDFNRRSAISVTD
jgi:hypothetical protein